MPTLSLGGQTLATQTGSDAPALGPVTLDANQSFPAGHVIQTVTKQVDSEITMSCSANVLTTVPTLQQSITPSSTSNKILLTVFIGAFNFSSTNYGLAGMGVFQRKIGSGSFTNVGAGTGTGTFNGTFSLAQIQSNQYYNGIMAQCIDTPDTTNECTYGIGVSDHNNGTQTFYLNRKNGFSDTPSQGTYSSSLIVMEIAA